MSFQHPLVLFALLIPAFLLAWVWRRRSRRVVLPFDHGDATSSGRGWRIALDIAESLPALVLAVVIVILAGPLQVGMPTAKRVLTNIEFCVDVSGSMIAQFGEGTRYDAAMAAIDEFLDFRDGDAFGLTFFGNEVLHWVPLTTDKSAIRLSPPFMKPGRLPRWFGGTSIGAALLACRKVLTDREEGDRMILLISDGRSSDLSGGRDLEIAKQLREDGIIVYGVHIGGGEVPGEIVNITTLTDGEAFQPGDPDALAHVFRRIDDMQGTRLERTVGESMDHYAPYCIAALSVLGAALLCLFGLRYTPW